MSDNIHGLSIEVDKVLIELKRQTIKDREYPMHLWTRGHRVACLVECVGILAQHVVDGYIDPNTCWRSSRNSVSVSLRYIAAYCLRWLQVVEIPDDQDPLH